MLAQEKKHLTELLAKIPTKKHQKVAKRKKSDGEAAAHVVENDVLELRVVGDVSFIHKLEYIAVEFGAKSVEELEVTTVPSEKVEEDERVEVLAMEGLLLKVERLID